MEAIISFIMFIVLLVYIIRLLIYHASRWFGLLFNMITTPIAMTAFVFRAYENVANEWFKDTLAKFLIVIIHSLIMAIIVILLHAPVNFQAAGADAFFNNTMVRLIIAIGGLHMLLHPSKWFMKWFNGENLPSSKQIVRRTARLIAQVKGFRGGV